MLSTWQRFHIAKASFREIGNFKCATNFEKCRHPLSGSKNELLNGDRGDVRRIEDCLAGTISRIK
jgi:hypothetical protein